MFTYKTPGLATGAIISVSAAVILAVYVAVCYVWRKKHAAAYSYPEGDELLARWENELMLETTFELNEEEDFETEEEETENM